MVEDIERGVGLVAIVIVLAVCFACHLPVIWLVVGPAIAGLVGYFATMFVDGSQTGRRAVNLL